jgi:hypothetical protein
MIDIVSAEEIESVLLPWMWSRETLPDTSVFVQSGVLLRALTDAYERGDETRVQSLGMAIFVLGYREGKGGSDVR